MTRQILCLFLLGLAVPAYAQVGPQAEAPDGATLFRRQCSTCHSLLAG